MLRAVASPRMERVKALLAEYGRTAIVVYLAMFVLVFAGFLVAIGAAGYEPDGAAGSAGLIGAAWLATKLTQPLRILATLALTPLVSAAVGRLKRRRAPRDEQ